MKNIAKWILAIVLLVSIPFVLYTWAYLHTLLTGTDSSLYKDISVFPDFDLFKFSIGAFFGLLAVAVETVVLFALISLTKAIKIWLDEKWIFSLILCFFLASCGPSDLFIENNNKETQGWIVTHQKPITATISDQPSHLPGIKRYTLKSKDNQFFDTGYISLVLPGKIE